MMIGSATKQRTSDMGDLIALVYSARCSPRASSLYGIPGDEGIARAHVLLNSILYYLGYTFSLNRPSYCEQGGMF